MTMTDFLNNSLAYLKSKLPSVPEHTVQEIAGHLTNMTAIAVHDEVENFANKIKRRERRKYPATPANTRSGRPPDIRKCGTCEHRYWHDPECNACNEGNGFKYYTAMKDGGAEDANSR